MFNVLGIEVCETPPGAEELESSMLSETIVTDLEGAAEEAAAVLASTVQTEFGRTTDPVRMYMREMGTVELLTRQGEIEIAQRIEEGIKEILLAMANYSALIGDLLKQYDLYLSGQIRLSDVITGFTDVQENDFNGGNSVAVTVEKFPVEEKEENVESVIEIDAAEGDGDTEGETGPDPALASKKFAELREYYEKLVAAEKKYGRNNKNAVKCRAKVAEAFMSFKLPRRQFDKMTGRMHDMLSQVRSCERAIMGVCVNKTKMPRRLFLASFPENETNLNWVSQNIIQKP
jgi:RNA polymerase primary sigma factor